MSSPPNRPRTRVLILIKGLGLGGAESLVAASAPHWDASRFDYRVAYMLPWKDQLVPRLAGSGVDVSCLDWRGPTSMGTRSRFRRLLTEYEPQIIHSHLPVAGLLARFSARSAANVYTEHNVVDFYRQPTRWFNRITYGRNQAIIAVSAAVAESLEGYPGPEPRVIPNGVLAPSVGEIEKAAIRAELGIDPSTPLVVHVGNNRPHKGHENLIGAVVAMKTTRSDIAVVSIGGEKHPGDLERVRRRAAQLGVGEQIRFMGRRSDAPSFIAAADVFVNPSDVEGLPISILEALALARPVVATDVGGVATVVIDRETGRLVPPNAPELLADALVETIESPDSSAWGKAGKKLVEENHGIEAMVREYEAVYDQVLA